MKAINIPESVIAKTQCDWIVNKATELKSLINYDSDSMICANKTRALSSIETMMYSLNELKAYVENHSR